jgi:hypothetical protein
MGQKLKTTQPTSLVPKRKYNLIKFSSFQISTQEETFKKYMTHCDSLC